MEHTAVYTQTIGFDGSGQGIKVKHGKFPFYQRFYIEFIHIAFQGNIIIFFVQGCILKTLLENPPENEDAMAKIYEDYLNGMEKKIKKNVKNIILFAFIFFIF